jgi:hypothetical protein
LAADRGGLASGNPGVILDFEKWNDKFRLCYLTPQGFLSTAGTRQQ